MQDQRQQLATLAQSLEQQMLQAAQGREQAYNDSSLTQQMLINIGAEMVGVWDSAKAIPQSIQMLGHIDLIPEKVAQLMTVLHDPQMRQTLETLATQYFHDSLYTEADDFHAAGEVYGGVLMAAILKQVGPGLASLIGSATQRFFALLAMQRFDALADAVGTVQAPFQQVFQLIQKANKTIKRKLGWQQDEAATGESLTTMEEQNFSNKKDSHALDYAAYFHEDTINFNEGYELESDPFEKDTYLVSFHSDKPVGAGRSVKWWTKLEAAKEFKDEEDIRQNLALPKSWGARNKVSIARIPKGRKLERYSGTAAPQFDETDGFHKGGGFQYRFKDFNTRWIIDEMDLEDFLNDHND